MERVKDDPVVSGLGGGRTGLLSAETLKTQEERSGAWLWTSSSEMPPGQAGDVEQTRGCNVAVSAEAQAGAIHLAWCWTLEDGDLNHQGRGCEWKRERPEPWHPPTYSGQGTEKNQRRQRSQ